LESYVKILVDLDGTLAGKSEWKNVWWNSFQVFKTGPTFTLPKECTWSIITGRPAIDKPMIQLFNFLHKLEPDEIITQPSLFYKFQNNDEVADWKNSVISKIFENNIHVDKIIYVENDPEFRSKILQRKNLILCSSDILKEVWIKHSKGDM